MAGFEVLPEVKSKALLILVGRGVARCSVSLYAALTHTQASNPKNAARLHNSRVADVPRVVMKTIISAIAPSAGGLRAARVAAGVR
jgi:hypothetical protein